MSTRLRAILTVPATKEKSMHTVRGGAVLRTLKKVYIEHIGPLSGKALPKRPESQIRLLWDCLKAGYPGWKKARLWVFREQRGVTYIRSQYRNRLKCFYFHKKGSKKVVGVHAGMPLYAGEVFEAAPPSPTVPPSPVTVVGVSPGGVTYQYVVGDLAQSAAFYQDQLIWGLAGAPSTQAGQASTQPTNPPPSPNQPGAFYTAEQLDELNHFILGDNLA